MKYPLAQLTAILHCSGHSSWLHETFELLWVFQRFSDKQPIAVRQKKKLIDEGGEAEQCRRHQAEPRKQRQPQNHRTHDGIDKAYASNFGDAATSFEDGEHRRQQEGAGTSQNDASPRQSPMDRRISRRLTAKEY